MLQLILPLLFTLHQTWLWATALSLDHFLWCFSSKLEFKCLSYNKPYFDKRFILFLESNLKCDYNFEMNWSVKALEMSSLYFFQLNKGLRKLHKSLIAEYCILQNVPTWGQTKMGYVFLLFFTLSADYSLCITGWSSTAEV